jgi:hypothetical protein
MSFNTTLTGEAFSVTKSDSTVISAFGFYVGGTGDVAVLTFPHGRTVIFKAVPVGVQIVSGAISKILDTGTTASDIVAYGL